jgi:hypothetical protein
VPHCSLPSAYSLRTPDIDLRTGYWRRQDDWAGLLGHIGSSTHREDAPVAYAAATPSRRPAAEGPTADPAKSPPADPREVLGRHAEAFASGDLDRIVADYAADALLITARAAYRGRAAIRSGFVELLARLEGARFERTAMVVERETLLLCWTARTDRGPLGDGNETFVFDGPLIRLHSVHFDTGAIEHE